MTLPEDQLRYIDMRNFRNEQRSDSNPWHTTCRWLIAIAVSHALIFIGPAIMACVVAILDCAGKYAASFQP
jgi:hypothetical protein